MEKCLSSSSHTSSWAHLGLRPPPPPRRFSTLVSGKRGGGGGGGHFSCGPRHIGLKSRLGRDTMGVKISGETLPSFLPSGFLAKTHVGQRRRKGDKNLRRPTTPPKAPIEDRGEGGSTTFAFPISLFFGAETLNSCVSR